MLQDRAPVQDIRRAVEDKFSKPVHMTDLHNLKLKIRQEKRAGRPELLQEWAEEFLKTRGNIVEKLVSKDGVLMCVFIQTNDMREAFKRFPELIMIDETFKVKIKFGEI